MREQLLGPVPLAECGKQLPSAPVTGVQTCALPIWRQDRMRLQEEDLTPEVLRTALLTLAGDPNPGSVRQGGALLYLCQNRGDFVNQMLIFDEWGLRPAGLRGPRENPVMVTALLVGHGDSSSSGGAGRHEAPETEGAPGGVTAQGDAHEGAALGARAAG